MKVLIAGATGSVGRELIPQLLERGVDVRAVTRNRTGAHLPVDIEVVEADSSEPATLHRPLNGVDALFVTPRSVGDAMGELLALARECNAQKVVLVSAITVEYGGGDRSFIEHFRTAESAVKMSGLDWTILRCSDFDANARMWSPQIHSSNIVRGAFGDVATACIHERDIAAVAALALTTNDHAGAAYALTGPERISQIDKVRAIGNAVERELEWEELPAEDVRDAMIAAGLPEEIPARLLGYLGSMRNREAPLTDTVSLLLDREPRSFAQWARDHAMEFGGVVC